MASRPLWIAAAATLALAAACGDKEKAQAPSADAGTAATAKTETVLDAASMPRRKPGLWQQTVKTGDMTQVSKFCLDAATEAKMTLWGQGATQDMCQQTQMTRKLDGSIAFTSVCNMGEGGKTTSRGTITGDFNSAYKMQISSTTEGASMAQMNGAHQMTMEAAYQGPCPAGFAPGDMEVNGMKFNIAKMAAK